MGKQRTTVTTCDYAECQAHTIGQGVPSDWLTVTIATGEDGSKEKLTFHAYTCLNNFAYARAEEAGEDVSYSQEGAPDSGD